MKILVISQYYYPEPFRHADICEALVQRGHTVTAIAGTPNYPMGVVYPQYRHGALRDEVRNGVRVHRCPTIGRRNNVFFRFLNYYSYVFSAGAYLLRDRETYDVIFVNQLSPVMMTEPALLYKKLHGTKVVLYCLDLWPESLIAGGVKRNELVYRFFHRVSQRIYRKVDAILTSSRSFDTYFAEQFGVKQVTYLPQYAEDLFVPNQCAKKADGHLDLMFAGNVGAAQSVDTILRAAELTRDETRIRWHIVGDGSELPRMQEQGKNLPNLIFHGRKPLDEMPHYYAMADAMLVTLQEDPVISLTLPGKVQSYLAAGKPILGAVDGEAALIIRDAECGICGKAEDGKALAQNARKMLSMDMVQLGVHARAYYETHFRKERFVDCLEQALENV